MLRFLAYCLAASGTVLAAAPSFAQDEPRLALLIANQSYPRDVGRLERPHEDADAIGNALEEAGFDVTIVRDRDEDQMWEAIFDFADDLSEAGPGVTGFFYYAGHGAATPDGRSFLIPARARVRNAREMIAQGVRLNEIVDRLRDALPSGGDRPPALFVVFDACRNTLRFANSGRRAIGGGGGGGRGFGVATRRTGLFIAHATLAGEFAPDDGAYAEALAREIRQPRRHASRAFEMANRAVASTRDMDSLPNVANALTRDVCFISCPRLGEVDRSPTGVGETAAFGAFLQAQEVNTIPAYELFLRYYGESPFADDARRRLASLRGDDAGAAFDEPEAVEPVSAGIGDFSSVLEDAARSEPPDTAEPADGREEALAAPDLTVVMQSRVGEADIMDGADVNAAAPAGAVFIDAIASGGHGPEMVVIPPGAFAMGSPPSEAGSETDEGPLHDVVIARAFAVGRFEVSWNEWDACVAAGGCEASGPASVDETAGDGSEGYGRGLRPAININWHEAQAYARWLSAETGETYRLMTEAEWEYAARGSTEPQEATRYFFGDESAGLCEYANVADQTAQAEHPAWTVAACEDGFVDTSPTGSFAPNPFGLYDMTGNVWEWVEDCYVGAYNSAPADGSAVTTGVCSHRVLRGGSFINQPDIARTANRIRSEAAVRGDLAGFRLAREL